MLISKSFDSGSIEIIDATDPSDVRLAILRRLNGNRDLSPGRCHCHRDA